MKIRIVKIIAAAIALCLGAASHAWAWGSAGHRIVAEIAEQHLEPEAARQLRALLALDNAKSLAEISNWAEESARQRSHTAPWHFVAIPVHPAPGASAGYDPARDCLDGNCLVAAIDRFAAELGDDRWPPRERLEALKWLVTLVGNIHQPLDCADDGDQGGRQIYVQFLGHWTNLHEVWDHGILAPQVKGDERGYAQRLARTITSAESTRWRGGPVADWANESYAIAVRVIYGELPHEPGVLPPSYEAAALPIVDEQLEKAGVRLAKVLDTVLH